MDETLRRQHNTSTQHHALSVIGLGLLTLLAGACGIPEEQHNEALSRIKQLQTDSTAAQLACDETLRQHQTKNLALQDENRALKTKLMSFGHDLKAIQTQAGHMVADLSQKDKQIGQLLKAQEAARRQAEIFRGLVSRFKQMIDAGTLKVNMRGGRMVVQLSDQILFDSGRAELKKDGQQALLEVTKVLGEIKGRNFQVAGHTDNIPIRTPRFKSNWELSTARAVNVVRFMTENGMPGEQISAAGYASFDPVGDNASDEGRKLNRRIEITLVPSLEELPQIGE